MRRRVWIQPAHRGWIWPIARQIVRPMLFQTGLLALLLGANRVPLPLFLVAGLPFVRALLTWSALVWPQWGQHPRRRWLTRNLADLYVALLLTLSVGLLRNLLLTSGVLTAVVAVPRPPKPAASGRVLDDGWFYYWSK